MSANRMLCAMAAGTALVILVGARHREPSPERRVAAPPPEDPWLTREAAEQVVGPGGALGPLFEGVELGGPAPSSEIRARIAAFARANHVDIGLDVVDGELAAVRFDVSYGGCCGYEGADVLALRLGRPHTGVCCVCGPDRWIDDWSIASEAGIYMRARVRVNRVVVRWEKTLTLPELVERADGLLGVEPATVRAAAGNRWIDLENRQYLLEIAYPFTRTGDFGDAVALRDRDDIGLHVEAERGRIAEVSFALHDLDDEALHALQSTLRARWGRPRTKQEDTWTWRMSDRTITAELGSYLPRITIRKR